jgi:hypothetical protein
MDRNFSAVCFIDFMAEKWGTKYFENIQAESDNQNFVQQVNEEPIQTNTDLCVILIGVFSTMHRHLICFNFCFV